MKAHQSLLAAWLGQFNFMNDIFCISTLFPATMAMLESICDKYMGIEINTDVKNN